MSGIAVCRCMWCGLEWDADGYRPPGLCPHRHATTTGWYRTAHQPDVIRVIIPEDAGALLR